MKNRIQVYISIFVSTVIFFGCEEVAEEIKPIEPEPLTPVNVLVDNSGFSHVFDDIRFLSSASAAPPYMDVLDFTTESNTMHLAYFSSQPTQQDAMIINRRVSINLQTKEKVALPAQADTLGYSPVSLAQKSKTLLFQQFRPYSNFFVYATTTFNGATKIEFQGDVYGSVGPTANPVGIPDFGYRFPCTNIAVNVADNGFSWLLTGIPNPTYALSGTQSNAFNVFNNTGKKIMTSFAEPDIFTYGQYRTLFVRTDSVIAYTINDERTQMTKKAAVTISGMSSTANVETKRHYSVDGKTLGVLIEDITQDKFWTFSYNFDTHVLVKGLDGVSLEYSGEGTDFDLDEFGNIYYSGFAGNGSNTNGVSIYKKAINGNVTVIGTDNFLKFGTIMKVKSLDGKIFVAVTGKQTNTSNYQLSILKQN